MKYLSFFSGVGCFENAIHQRFPRAQCLGFSEIDSYAIEVYTHHFPRHSNLGDITHLKEADIRGLMRAHQTCDLIVGGFPCQDLSSMAHFYDAKGLQGKRSGLFFTFLRVLKWIFKHSSRRPKVIIENNASMSQDNQDTITQMLQKQLDQSFQVTLLDGPAVGMLQRRRRLFWTNFGVPRPHPERSQTWADVLVSARDSRSLWASDERIQTFNRALYPSTSAMERPRFAQKQRNGWYTFKYGKEKQKYSRWKYLSNYLDTGEPFARTVMCSDNQFIIFRNPTNPEQFRLRHLHPLELERLFGLPDGYVSDICSRTRVKLLLGNAIIVPVVQHIVRGLPV